MAPSQVGNKAKSPEKGVSDDQDLQVDDVGRSDVVEDIQLIPNELFLNCIDRDSMELMSIPSITYEICIQRRIDVAKATVIFFTKSVPVSKKPHSQYSEDDSSSDESVHYEDKIDSYLRIFIMALPYLETIHYGFHLNKNNVTACLLCSSARCLTPWRMKHGIEFEDDAFCKHTAFKSTSSFLQHCRDKGNNFHASTVYYLDQLYFKSAGIYDNQVDSIGQSSSFIENVVDSNVIVGEKDRADINVDVEIDDSYEGQNDKDHVDLIQEVDSEEKQEPPFPKVIDDNIIEQQEADKEEGDNISEDSSVKATQQKGKRIILNKSGDDLSKCSRFSHSDDFVTSEAGGEKIGGSEDEDNEKADEDNKVDGKSEGVSAVRMARDRH